MRIMLRQCRVYPLSRLGKSSRVCNYWSIVDSKPSYIISWCILLFCCVVADHYGVLFLLLSMATFVTEIVGVVKKVVFFLRYSENGRH
jgi:hypothetical protein